MYVSIETSSFKNGIWRIPCAIFRDVAVTIVGKVKAEKAGWNPCFKIRGNRLKTKKKNDWDAIIIMMNNHIGNWFPKTRTNDASRRENGAQ